MIIIPKNVMLLENPVILRHSWIIYLSERLNFVKIMHEILLRDNTRIIYIHDILID